jgi:class 3 adenylate cyclase
MANGIDIENSRIAGVEIHAGVAAMLMDGRFIRMASGATTLWWVFGLALFSAIITAGLRDWINRVARRVSTWWIARGHRWRLHDPIWLCLYIAVAILPVVSYWDLAVWLFSHERYCLVFVYPAMSAMFTSGSILLYSFASETAERRKALAQFSRLVSPEVMEEILSHPEEQYPRPKRVYATVMFTDLEGFTTYSEGHEPEEVVEAINGLFGRLEPIVHDYGGTLDKYIGDAIMAFFGAPVPRFDHAARTLHCAIALQNECAQFRIDTGIPFYMRIGIHTGDVIVGCVGGAERVDYTVIGDTVNLASRLEGKNKEFGSWIMCSSASHDAAPGVAIVESASTQIKGKSQAVDVFIVRGLIGDEVIDARWGHALDSPRQADTIDSQVQQAAPALEREGMLALEGPRHASSAGEQPSGPVVAIETGGDASPH